MNNNFKHNLNKILEELSDYKKDNAKLIEYYINKRLNDSLVTYYDTLQKSVDFFASKDELKVLKKLNK